MLEQMGKAAKQASWQLAVLSTAKKNQVLLAMADAQLYLAKQAGRARVCAVRMLVSAAPSDDESSAQSSNAAC